MRPLTFALLMSAAAVSPPGKDPQERLSANDDRVLQVLENPMDWSLQTADLVALVEAPSLSSPDNCSSVQLLHSMLFVSSSSSSRTSREDLAASNVALAILIALGVIGLSVMLGLFTLCRGQKSHITEVILAYGTVTFIVALVIIVRRPPHCADSCQLGLLYTGPSFALRLFADAGDAERLRLAPCAICTALRRTPFVTRS